MGGFSIKKQAKFQNMREKRNATHSLFSQLGHVHQSIMQDVQKNAKNVMMNIESLGHNIGDGIHHLQKEGFKAGSSVGHFQMGDGSVDISASWGKHNAQKGRDKWYASNNGIQATAFEASMHSQGSNWDVDGGVSIGDVAFSANGTIIKKSIDIQDGWDNGPNFSGEAKADLVKIQAGGTIGTDEDQCIGIRLRGDVSAVWGASVEASGNRKKAGVELNTLKVRTSANFDVKLDHKNASGERVELASLKLKQGKVRTSIDWEEIGNVLHEHRFKNPADIFHFGPVEYH